MIKIFVFLFSLLLLSGVCLAADPLSPRQDSLRVYIYQELPLSTGGTDLIDNPIVNWAINMGISATCRRFPAFEALDTVSVHIGTGEGITLNADFLRINRSFRLLGDTMRYEMVASALDTTQPLSKNAADYKQELDKANDPLYYRSFANRYFTNPKVRQLTATPDSFLIEYYGMAPGLFADGDEAAVLQTYLQAVVWYGVATLHRRRHRFDLADYYMRLFEQFQVAPVTRKEVGLE